MRLTDRNNNNRRKKSSLSLSPNMDDLPSALIIEILSRINDSTDLARCRLASKTLNTLSYEVRSLNLICSSDRYLKSRSQDRKTLITPFKSIVKKFLLSSRNLEFVSVGVELRMQEISDADGDDESDDLFLTGVNFVSEWLPGMAGRLRSLSISDFWIQACWRRSNILSLISSCCNRLVELEVKNAWLSLEGLKPMPMLTNLTLEFIRLDDEDLKRVNECFPSLQVLNLIGVGGLRDPRIHLLHLKTFKWIVSNAPLSLTIEAPNLIELELKCIKPRIIILKAPLLASLHLYIEKVSEVFEVERFLNLKSLVIESSDLCNLIRLFQDSRTVEQLVMDSPKCAEPDLFVREKIDFEGLLRAFPNLNSLTLGPGAWSELQTSFHIGGLEGRGGWKGLNRMMVRMVVSDVESTRSSIFSLLERFTTLSDVEILIHRDAASDVKSHLFADFMHDCSRVRWKWGVWKEGQKDTWFC